MFGKLALRNVRRSARDYLGVCADDDICGIIDVCI